MAVIYIGLGSNRGDRMQYLKDALHQLKQTGTFVKSSAVYETPSWGYESDQPYLNAVVKLETLLSPEEVLTSLHAIEADSGRTRSAVIRYTDRTLDLDLLYYDSLVKDTEHINVPHPRIAQRNFVLKPMLDIDPEWLDARTGFTVLDLWNALEDTGEIEIYPSRLV